MSSSLIKAKDVFLGGLSGFSNSYIDWTIRFVYKNKTNTNVKLNGYKEFDKLNLMIIIAILFGPFFIQGCNILFNSL